MSVGEATSFIHVHEEMEASLKGAKLECGGLSATPEGNAHFLAWI